MPPPDLADSVGDEIAGWGADHVTVALRYGSARPIVVGDAGRVYALASITKLFTAVATLVAVEEGALGLADPAGPVGSTVRHLLAHASGMDFDRPSSLAQPGLRRIYSNAGYETLAATVAEATGIDFLLYATEAVVEPLGLVGTRVEGSPARGWSAAAEDVLTLLDQVRDPTILAAETMTVATSVAFPGLPGKLPGVGRFEPLDWGLGFEIRNGKQPHWTGTANAAETVGHFGGRGTFCWHDPVADVTCVGLTDRDFGPWALEAWPRLSDLVLTNGPRRPTK